MVRPSSCIVKGGIRSSRRYLPTYLQVMQRVMVRRMMPVVRVLQVMQRVMVPLVMQMVGVLQVMPRFLGTVMGTSTHQGRY